MPPDHVPPQPNATAFNCPHCGAFAQQAWPSLYTEGVTGGFTLVQSVTMNVCRQCDKIGVWTFGILVYPATSTAPLAHQDMPEDVKADYNEARAIVAASPRGACALLRLGLQKLGAELGEPGKNINDDIKSLVSKGLLPQVQQALDALRVVGNNAVHPGELDLKDDVATASALFGAMNLIVEQMITAPKQITALYTSLPQGALDAIEKRDGGGDLA